jgi:hypothetical protein
LPPRPSLALVFHDGRRRRWEAGDRAARKDSRMSPEVFEAGGVAEVAGGIAIAISRRMRRVREDTRDMCQEGAVA